MRMTLRSKTTNQMTPRKSTNTQPMSTTETRSRYESKLPSTVANIFKTRTVLVKIFLSIHARSNPVTGFVHFPFSLDALALKTWGQRLSQFVSLFGVLHLQCVQVTRASDLELGFGITLADLDKLGVASACLLKEVSDIGNLLWHCCVLSAKGRRRKVSGAVLNNSSNGFQAKNAHPSTFQIPNHK